jgi:hypothetical protein
VYRGDDGAEAVRQGVHGPPKTTNVGDCGEECDIIPRVQPPPVNTFRHVKTNRMIVYKEEIERILLCIMEVV